MDKPPRDSARAIVIRDGFILLIYRLKNGKEYFVLPGGGIEMNETSEQAVLREVKEEAGITIKPEKLIYELIESSGAKQDFWLCFYIEGEPNLSQDSIEKQIESEVNVYRPQWFDLKKINEIILLPPLIKEALVCDIKAGKFVYKKILEK